MEKAETATVAHTEVIWYPLSPEDQRLVHKADIEHTGVVDGHILSLQTVDTGGCIVATTYSATVSSTDYLQRSSSGELFMYIESQTLLHLAVHLEYNTA